MTSDLFIRLSPALAAVAGALTVFAASQVRADVETLRARNAEIVRQTPAATGLLEVLSSGDVRHRKSGLLCPASFPNLAFLKALVEPLTGGARRVGCAYARVAKDGQPISELSITAAPAEGRTLDALFAAEQGAFRTTAPGARYVGPALKFAGGPASASQQPPDFRSAEYVDDRGGASTTRDIIVTRRGGWVLEVEAAFPSTVNGGTLAEQAAIAEDPAGPAVAFLDALKSVKDAPPEPAE